MRILLALLLSFSLSAWADALPLQPVKAGTVTISCSSVSGATALSRPNGANQPLQVELQNAGSAAIFVEFGDSTVSAATTTGYPILAGQSKLVTVAGTVTHIACIVAASTHTLYVTVGLGI